MQLMVEVGLTVSGLAEKSGVSENTARRAVQSRNHARLNTTSATAIAEALDSLVGDINWVGGLANDGRPAGSGGKYTSRSD